MSFFKSLLDELNKIAQEQKELETVVAQYLFRNPNPTDETFHKWAETEGIDVHLAEAAAYRLATKFANLMFGGKSGGNPPEGMTKNAEARGTKVELEHTRDSDVARKIAWDHIAEHPAYYDGLEEMEKHLEAEGESE